MEKEGKEYEDKDTFLTSAYRKKLEERKKMEEELRKEEKKEGEVIEKRYLRTCFCFSFPSVLPSYVIQTEFVLS